MQKASPPTKVKAPMRSSIACLRCRRSKIKCDNDGGNSPCDTCIKSGHQCQYPEATFVPLKRGDGSKRADAAASVKQDREVAHERKRVKKSDEPPVIDNNRSAAYAAEVLSYPFLTEELWDQVFGLYKLHFATELPFLHLPTLKEQMSRKKKDVEAPSPDLNLVLLGVLTLTARFHTDLSKYVSHISAAQASRNRQSSTSRSDHMAAGDFFANALSAGLGPLGTAMTVATVERVQALLMLGFYEWGQRQQDGAIGAWMYIGIAIRLAQTMRFGFEDGVDTPQSLEGADSSSPGLRAPRQVLDAGIAREVKRRTMFSCFILDRMLACGHERPSVIRPEDLEIQLPCTEMAFDLALDVQTPYLRPQRHQSLRPPNDDSVMSRFVQLVDLWGDLSRYCVAGGRFMDREPWEQTSTFYRLREHLDDFVASLPPTFTLSRQNYYRHDNHQATNMYVSLHMFVSACQIILHREHLPCIPLRYARPEGIRSTSPGYAGKSRAHDAFWKDSAEIVFKAARDIVDLVEICREKLPLSFLSLFAIWTASFVGIYAHHFPWMDTGRHMVSEEESAHRMDGAQSVPKSATTDVLYQALAKITIHVNRGEGFLALFEEVHAFYATAFREYRGYSSSPREAESGADNRGLSIRLGIERVGGAQELPGISSMDVPRSARSSESQDVAAYSAERTSPSQHGSSSRSGIDSSRNTPLVLPMSFTAINNHTGLPSMDYTSRLGETPHMARHMTPAPHLSPIHQHDAPPVANLSFSMERLDLLEAQRILDMVNDIQGFSGIRF